MVLLLYNSWVQTIKRLNKVFLAECFSSAIRISENSVITDRDNPKDNESVCNFGLLSYVSTTPSALNWQRVCYSC